MSLFFLDDPIKESDRSILNNSILDDHDHDNHHDDYYNHPMVSGFPFFYGYPPYAYHSNPQSASGPKSVSKPNANAATRRQSSHSFDKDVYKLVDFRPKNNLCEDDKNYYIQLDLPGMTKEQIHMELSEDSILTISGERENKYKQQGMPNHMKISKMECEYGKFSRSFSIPETANLDSIQAKMENGVLEVTISKAKTPKTQRRKIKVK